MVAIATSLGLKILPLYITIVLGYVVVHFFGARRENMASLLIYIIGPVVIFLASYKVKLNLGVVSLPILLYLLSSFLALISLKFGSLFFRDNTKNILAFTAGTGNTGYFGIPLAIMLLDEGLANIYIFTVLASLLYESTVGFFVVAKGHYSIKQSLIKVAKLPSIYALILGLVFNLAHIELSHDLVAYLDYFKGAYAILGMMMIGMGLKGLAHVGIDKLFMGVAFFIKFIIYPAMVLLLIWIDSMFFHFFSMDLYRVMFIFSIVPMAGNTVAVASLLNVHPEKASLAVILSTVISIVSIPVMLALFMPQY
ncbi:AEC family transporter [Sulfurospirillum sp. 1612]|uniref:AEC family transporter n=1 Tax=Sulfurospirillum sp. 1612 TaxID=3094835 RepID=UPI002F94F351